jgi:hypothetical protein
LPLTTAALARHLAWESRRHALWVVLPAAGFLASCVGLVSPWWVAALALAFALLLVVTARVGAALGARSALRSVRTRPDVDPLVGALSSAPPSVGRPGRPAPRWRRAPAWLALWAKDLVMTRRVPALRRSALAALALVLFSALAWGLPFELDLRRFSALALILVAAAAVAEWLVALSGSDPFAVLRSLPLGARTVWGARAAWAALTTAALLLLHAATARDLSSDALRLFLAWSGAAALGIGALGVNYGVTLFPRADVAHRLLALSLGLAVAASIMLPLSGWIVLLSAILHSARRLPRWSRLEET